MKAKIILYGWALSWIFLFAGAGTMDSGNYMAGALLSAVWFAFSLALITNEEACGKEMDRFEAWMDSLFSNFCECKGINKGNGILRQQTMRDIRGADRRG